MDNQHIHVTLLLLFWTYKSSAQITLTADLATVKSLQNNDISLTCITSGVSAPVMQWKLPNGAIHAPADYGSDTFGPDGRYTFQTSGGRHSIRIRNVQPVDDGAYQCTLVPQEAYGYVHKKSSLTLAVLVPPGAPMIEGIENAAIEPSSADVQIITVPHDVDKARIKCTVGPSKPLIPIKWFLDGEELTANIETLTAYEDPVTKLETSSSVLTIADPGDVYNGKQYKCTADLSDLEMANLHKVFNLSVQSPPSIPVIEGWQNTSYQPNDTVILECKALGGNPLPTLQWYRDGIPYRHEFRTFESIRTVISTIVINIEASDNNREYRCDAKNAALATARTSNVKFKVRFPPKFVTIDGTGLVKAGSSITLSCTTDNSNPRAIINWYSKGQLINPDGDSKVEASDNGGFITQSNITFIANRSDHAAEYMCQASNHQLHGVVYKSINLDVAYPPDSMSITGYDSARTVVVDTAHRLTCTTTGGNPLPDLTWYSGSTKLTNVGTMRETGNIRSLEYQFIATPKDNGAVYKCVASHANVPEPHSETNITVNVFYPPQNVTITPQHAFRDGTAVTLECDSGASNPVSSIRWLKNETEIVDSRITSSSTAAAHGGKATVSRYTFTPVASDNGLIIQCSARNPEIGRSATRGLTLDIQHKPIFRGIPTKITVTEGSNSTENNFTVISNPPASKYTWFQVDDGVETELKFEAKRDGSIPQISVDGALLHLVHINRDKAGNYRVKADNDIGQSSLDFSIDVHYAAGIPNNPSQTYTDGDSTLKLFCVVDANPPIADLATNKWTRLDYDMGRATQSLESGSGNLRTLVLTISSVIREDIGTFTCEAQNSLGSAAMKDYTVDPVAFQPVINKAPSTAKAAAQTHTDGDIKCNMEAFPRPAVEWSKDGQLLSLDGSKYSMSTKKQGKIIFTFHLTVKSVTDTDYGVYQCKARNSKGEDTHDITLGGRSKPDIPTGLEMLNITDSSVILAWIESFDGGLTQTFRIRYHTSGGQFLYADASGPPYTLEGLKSESSYEISLMSFNDEGSSSYHGPITVTTSVTPTQAPVVVSPPKADDPMLIVIMALAVVGGLLLIVTTVLVCIFVRRRRKRKLSEATDSASQSNTVEMYGTHDGSFFNDDAKSYSTYEKGLDEDYAKHYDDDEDDDTDHVKKGSKGTYLTDDPSPIRQSPPWSKMEDPHGNAGLYIRHPPASHVSEPRDENYANELRNKTKSLQKAPANNIQRPAWVANRPPAPAPPGRSTSHPTYDSPPLVPDRNYSPVTDYQAYTQAGLYHASFGRSTPSVESTDDMRGHLV
nr:nephrin [Membranipora membranacea]